MTPGPPVSLEALFGRRDLQRRAGTRSGGRPLHRGAFFNPAGPCAATGIATTAISAMSKARRNMASLLFIESLSASAGSPNFAASIGTLNFTSVNVNTSRPSSHVNVHL